MKQRLRVGVSGALDRERTIHGRTLLRSITTAINAVPGFGEAAILFGNDEASGSQACEIAGRFITAGVDVVLGPFGSDCLMAAAALYAEASIPVVTPAATACLDQPLEAVFRICPNDHAIAAGIVGRIRERGFRQVHVTSDDSRHCRGLKGMITAALGSGIIAPPSDPTEADALVFTGKLQSSRAWLSKLRERSVILPVLMTDDAAASELLGGIDRPGDLEVLGFPAAHQVATTDPAVARYQHFHGTPPVYCLETLAAAAVIAQAGPPGGILAALQCCTFATALGPVRFDRGERFGATLAWWKPGRDGALSAHDLVVVPQREPMTQAVLNP